MAFQHDANPAIYFPSMFFFYFVMFFLCLQSLHKCLTSPIFTWILFPLHLLRFILIWDLTHNKPTRDADTLDHLGPRSWQFNEIYRQNSKQEPHKPPDSAESEWRQLGFSVKGKYFTLWKGISRNDFMRVLRPYMVPVYNWTFNFIPGIPERSTSTKNKQR